MIATSATSPENVTALDDYQEKAGVFQIPTAPPEARVMGLLSEAGEVAGVFQKLLQGNYDLTEATARLHKELGDALWNIARIAADNGWKLSDIAQSNLDKLESRKLRSLIMGDGDNR